MPIHFMTAGLLIISIATNLTVEGIKKLLDEMKLRYASNALAAGVSIVLAGAVCAIYLLLSGTALTVKTGVDMIILMYLSFLVSTVGYDKVIQLLGQIESAKEVTKHE